MSNNVIPPRNLDVTAPEQQLPAEWANRMAQYAKQGLAAERVTGNMFSSRNGQLSFGGQAVPNNRMQVIVIGAMHERVWYDKPYAADAPISPACYAFSFTGEDMKPHDEVDNPVNPTCAGCPKDEWKSDPVRGKGKACKEQRRIALIPASALATPDDVAKATVGYLRIPVTSTKAFSEHVKHLGMRLLPIFAAVSEVELKPDPKNMWAFTFKLIAPITQTELLAALETRYLAELKAMDFPYPKAAPAPDPAAAAAANSNRKF
jgi:hypothetical protein